MTQRLALYQEEELLERNEKLYKQTKELFNEISVLRTNIFKLTAELEKKHIIKLNDFSKGDVVIITLDDEFVIHVYHTSNNNVMIDQKSIGKILMSSEFIRKKISHKVIFDVRNEYVGNKYTTVLTLETK